MFIAPAILVLAAGIWIAALIVLVGLARRLSGRRSGMQMLLNGTYWFDERNFVPEAARLVRAFRMLTVAFFACLLAVGVVIVLVSR